MAGNSLLTIEQVIREADRRGWYIVQYNQGLNSDEFHCHIAARAEPRHGLVATVCGIGADLDPTIAANKAWVDVQARYNGSAAAPQKSVKGSPHLDADAEWDEPVMQWEQFLQHDVTARMDLEEALTDATDARIGADL